VPRNEDGEFELILGNRQLLSVFFIIVILLGVFFTMGYIVGRNSAPLTELTSTTKQEAKPIVVEPAPRQPEAPKPEAPPPAAVERNRGAAAARNRRNEETDAASQI
jgi:type IV secretory pathway VirB10-like protein